MCQSLESWLTCGTAFPLLSCLLSFLGQNHSYLLLSPVQWLATHSGGLGMGLGKDKVRHMSPTVCGQDPGACDGLHLPRMYFHAPKSMRLNNKTKEQKSHITGLEINHRRKMFCLFVWFLWPAFCTKSLALTFCTGLHKFCSWFWLEVSKGHSGKVERVEKEGNGEELGKRNINKTLWEDGFIHWDNAADELNILKSGQG